ncbi:PD-(D/E)XK nuclease family protein [Salinigranum halophilum]|uniref:PD-(D/E)XK nuclease family protein n=1 Tax=Salinigranum halophilum TaxID=2565931 RepID=UPI00115E6372|nr:PD-(D/E)XK nuclease family protein [Salinigranum halophilum]
MSVSNGIELAYIVERDVDLVFVQLVQSSSDFRQWFLEAIGERELEFSFTGVCHSVMTENGESDIEIGFTSRTGERIRVLVENKINAAKQDRQFARYFERGEHYISKDSCDRVTVCLIAPEGYASASARAAVDEVVTYEEMLGQMQSIDHPSSEFFECVFEEALRKPTATDHSELTGEIRRQFASQDDHLPELSISKVTPTQVTVESTNPDHPSTVSYKVYVPGKYDGRTAIVRIEIDSSVPEAEKEAIQTLLSDHVEELDEFEATGNIMDAVRTSVEVEEGHNIDEKYVSEVVTNLCTLIKHYHSKLSVGVESNQKF